MRAARASSGSPLFMHPRFRACWTRRELLDETTFSIHLSLPTVFRRLSPFSRLFLRSLLCPPLMRSDRDRLAVERLPSEIGTRECEDARTRCCLRKRRRRCVVRSCFPSTGADRERKIDSFSAVRLFSFGSSVALFLLGSLSLPGDFPTFHDEAYETSWRRCDSLWQISSRGISSRTFAILLV